MKITVKAQDFLDGLLNLGETSIGDALVKTISCLFQFGQVRVETIAATLATFLAVAGLQEAGAEAKHESSQLIICTVGEWGANYLSESEM